LDWHENKYKDQKNIIEDPDMNPWNNIHLILTKEPKTYDGGKTTSSTNVAEKTGCLSAEN
jgi:hypothetical protein